MEQIPCFYCGGFFDPSPRHKNQSACKKVKCQRAKKAAWKRLKMEKDPKFKGEQYLVNKKWAQNHPGYWKAYRKQNPKKAERNRALQTIRNRRRYEKRKTRAKTGESVIAKVDALKVYMYEIPSPYQ